jgi:hypothetical protein
MTGTGRLVMLLENAIAFVECTYRPIAGVDSLFEIELNRFLKSLTQFKNYSHGMAGKNKGFDRSIVGAFGRSCTRFRKASKGKHYEINCNSQWERLGFAYHIVF